MFCGGVGAGKTHLAVGIAHRLMEQGRIAVFTSVINAIRRVKDTYRRDSGQSEAQVVAGFIRPDLLILDEVGVQFGSETEKMILFEIINGRYEQLKPTIVISNAKDAHRLPGRTRGRPVARRRRAHADLRLAQLPQAGRLGAARGAQAGNRQGQQDEEGTQHGKGTQYGLSPLGRRRAVELVALVLAGRLAAARSQRQVHLGRTGLPRAAGPDDEPAPIPVHMDHARKVQKLYDSLAHVEQRVLQAEYPRRHEYAGLTAGERITRACDRLDISPVYYKIALGHMKDQVRRAFQ